MLTTVRFKARLLFVLVLVAATVHGAVAMVRRSHHYAKEAESANVEMKRLRHSAEFARGDRTHYLVLAELTNTDPLGAAHQKHRADRSRKWLAYCEEQADRAASLKEGYERLASRPWESEPASIEEIRQRMLNAKHPSFP